MEDMRDALLRLVLAWTRANKALESFVKAGMDSNLLFQVCGLIEEALCFMTGEQELDLEDTVTHTALTAPHLSEERRVSLLMYARRENRKDDPCRFLTPEDVKNMVMETGGYCSATGYVPPKKVAPTPEGEWT